MTVLLATSRAQSSLLSNRKELADLNVTFTRIRLLKSKIAESVAEQIFYSRQ